MAVLCQFYNRTGQMCVHVSVFSEQMWYRIQ